MGPGPCLEVGPILEVAEEEEAFQMEGEGMAFPWGGKGEGEWRGW